MYFWLCSAGLLSVVTCNEENTAERVRSWAPHLFIIKQHRAFNRNFCSFPSSEVRVKAAFPFFFISLPYCHTRGFLWPFVFPSLSLMYALVALQWPYLLPCKPIPGPPFRPCNTDTLGNFSDPTVAADQPCFTSEGFLKIICFYVFRVCFAFCCQQTPLSCHTGCLGAGACEPRLMKWLASFQPLIFLIFGD